MNIRMYENECMREYIKIYNNRFIYVIFIIFTYLKIIVLLLFVCN